MTERKPLKIFVVESKQPEINLLALSTYEQRQGYRERDTGAVIDGMGGMKAPELVRLMGRFHIYHEDRIPPEKVGPEQRVENLALRGHDVLERDGGFLRFLKETIFG
jgi:hypothetical protein